MIALVFGFLCCFGIATSDDSSYEKQEELLKSKLLENYDKNKRPSSNGNGTTFVTLTVRPHFLIDLEEEESLLHMYAWFTLIWTDDRLKWNYQDEMVSVIDVPDGAVWQPKLEIYDGLDSHIDPMRDSQVYINSQGAVYWIPPGEIRSYCNIKSRSMERYPNDIHTCIVTLFSPTYNGIELNIKKVKLEMNVFRNTHPTWEILTDRCNITRHVAKYDCCSEYFYEVNVIIVLKRRPPAHLQVVQLPFTILITLTLSMFWLPSDSGKKIVLGALATIGLIILIIYVAAFTDPPRAAFWAVQPFQSVLISVSSAVLLEIFVLNLSRLCGFIKPPESFSRFLSGPFGRFLCVWMPRRKFAPVDEIELHGTEIKDTTKKEWLLIATFLDRLLFIVFVIIFAATHWS